MKTHAQILKKLHKIQKIKPHNGYDQGVLKGMKMAYQWILRSFK